MRIYHPKFSHCCENISSKVPWEYIIQSSLGIYHPKFPHSCGHFTHIVVGIYHPKFSWEYIIQSSHIVVRIYHPKFPHSCGNIPVHQDIFGCLFLLVRLYTGFLSKVRIRHFFTFFYFFRIEPSVARHGSLC